MSLAPKKVLSRKEMIYTLICNSHVQGGELWHGNNECKWTDSLYPVWAKCKCVLYYIVCSCHSIIIQAISLS